MVLFTQDLPIKICPDKILLYLKVTPKAASNKIGKILDKALKIYVRAAPEDGQANKAVIELLANNLKLTKNTISIEAGLMSQRKIVSIIGDQAMLIKRLQIMIS